MTVSRIWDQRKAFPWPRIEWPLLPLTPPAGSDGWWPLQMDGSCRMILYRSGEFVPAFVFLGATRDLTKLGGLRRGFFAISWDEEKWFPIDLDEDERHMAECELAPPRAWARLYENKRWFGDDDQSGMKPSSSSD